MLARTTGGLRAASWNDPELGMPRGRCYTALDTGPLAPCICALVSRDARLLLCSTSLAAHGPPSRVSPIFAISWLWTNDLSHPPPPAAKVVVGPLASPRPGQPPAE